MAPFSVAHSTHIQIDDSPTQGSDNLVTSGALHTALATKESNLTFANGVNTVTGGAISRAVGSDTVVFTPSAPLASQCAFMTTSNTQAITDQPTAGISSLLSSLLLSAEATDVTNGMSGRHNIGSHYKITGSDSGLFVVPSAGIYHFYANCTWQTGSFVQNHGIQLRICKSTDITSGGTGAAIHGSNEAWGNYFSQHISITLQLASGDKIGLYGGLNGGTAKLWPNDTTFGGYCIA